MSRTLSSDNEVGIDGIAVIVNGALVTTAEQVDELAERNGFVEAVFMFVSAKRSPHFKEAQAGNLAMAVRDFFGEAALTRTPLLDRYLEIKTAIYERGAYFNRGLPKLRLYYVTTGDWDGQDVVLHRLADETASFEKLNLFDDVSFRAVGAKELRDFYFRTQQPISNTFDLDQKATLPTIPGVTEAYLGVIPATELVRLLTDDAGQIRKSLFTDNVRDFSGAENPVNKDIRGTINSTDRDRFPILNNGVTIVARKLRVTGNRLYIEAYQIVNGGQTSHVLFNERDSLDERLGAYQGDRHRRR